MKSLYAFSISKEIVKERIVGYINDFFEWIGEKDIRIGPENIEIEDSLEMKEAEIKYTKRVMEKGILERLVIYLNDTFYGFKNARNLDEILRKIKKASPTLKHEAFHYLVFKKYDEELWKFDEGPASLITMYEALRNEDFRTLGPLCMYLEDRFKKEISEKGEFLISKVNKEARKCTRELIKKEREYLLVNGDYINEVKAALNSYIEPSLVRKVKDSSTVGTLVSLMAETILDMLKRAYNRYGNLEEALRETIRSYPEYAKLVMLRLPEYKK